MHRKEKLVEKAYRATPSGKTFSLFGSLILFMIYKTKRLKLSLFFFLIFIGV